MREVNSQLTGLAHRWRHYAQPVLVGKHRDTKAVVGSFGALPVNDIVSLLNAQRATDIYVTTMFDLLRNARHRGPDVVD